MNAGNFDNITPMKPNKPYDYQKNIRNFISHGLKSLRSKILSIKNIQNIRLLLMLPDTYVLWDILVCYVLPINYRKYVKRGSVRDSRNLLRQLISIPKTERVWLKERKPSSQKLDNDKKYWDESTLLPTYLFKTTGTVVDLFFFLEKMYDLNH